jgi:mono/diheme cytochrome c family protein
MKIPAIPYRLNLVFVCALSAVALRAQDVAAERGVAVDYSPDPMVIAKGKTLFTQNCAACHALTTDGFGPPLGGVTELLAPGRLAEWIRDPSKVVAAGDARANALFRRYKLIMPTLAHLMPDDVAAILSFIHGESVARHLAPFVIDPNTPPAARLIPPVAMSRLVVEVEDFVQIPRLPGRTPYKGITLLRPDPRTAGALFVDELMGLLYRVQDRRPAVFLDVRGIFPSFLTEPGVASGLGSFALHPDFVHNGIFYTTHSETFRGSPAVNSGDIPPDVPKYETPPLEWVLTEWRLTDPQAVTFAGTHREVMRFVTPTTGHGSQEIAFAPVTDPHDPGYGLLYLALGDGGSTNLKRPDMSGHPRTFLGAILRIDPAGHNGANGQYGIPPGNPFAPSSDPAIRKEIYAYGFRNAHRISWDFAHGRRMIAVDIGESNVEEVNLIEKGGAYGYGVGCLEGTTHLAAKVDAKVVRAATAAELAPYLPPFGEYDHSDGAAITGGYVYRGPLAALRGKYVFGDIVTGRLFFMNLDAAPADHTIYELNLMRDGAVTSLKALGRLDRAHLRIGYDGRTGDLFFLTKGDGMIRRVTKAYER